MDNFCPEVKRTGIYRVHDPVKYFKVRICLKRTVQVPVIFEEAITNSDGDGELELQELQQNKDEMEEYVFKWGEKVFSEREVEIYSQESLCVSFLDRKYHEKVKNKRKKKRKKPVRLFSYVDADIAEGKFHYEEPIATGRSEPSFLAERVKSLRLRHHIQGLQHSSSESVAVQSKHVVQNTKRSHFTMPSHQKMYIMANLTGTEEGQEADEVDEVVLCEITLDSNGVLMVNPDFSTSYQRPYCIRNSRNELFHYTIWNESQPISEEDAENERMIWKKMSSYNSEILKKCVGTEFNMPSENELKVFVNGEIVSARNFEYDSLYINYSMELPDGWYTASSSNLSGSSQRCDTKVEELDEVAYFGLPFEMELSFMMENSDTDEIKPQWPKIYFEVFSVDFWGCNRTEGYTYVEIPSSPGTYTLMLCCWRPRELTCREMMRRFFIGGSAELQDSSFLAVPSSLQGSRLSKFGFQSQSSGEVFIRLNIAHQSLLFIRSGQKKKIHQTITDWLKSGSGDDAIAGILASYHRTRQKMLQTRRELEMQLSTT